jgi:integrase
MLINDLHVHHAGERGTARGTGAARQGIPRGDQLARNGGDEFAVGRLIKRADLRTIRLHDLRHTHAVRALKAGVPVKVISERLGHELPAFTLKQYAHVIPGLQAAAAALVADIIKEQGEAA